MNLAVDPIWLWIGLGVVVLLILLVVIRNAVRGRRSAELRERFGSEYDYQVKEKGRARAERDLLDRAGETRSLQVRALTAEERNRFREEWLKIETRFVERPTTAVVEADELVSAIMRAQGYPAGDVDRNALLLASNHPRAAHHYRAGHAAIDANRDGKSSTEELRQSLLHYRELINELLAGAAGPSAASDAQEPLPQPR